MTDLRPKGHSMRQCLPAWWVHILILVASGVGWLSELRSAQPLTHEILWKMKQVGEPSPSPDGRWVIVPVIEPAYEEKDERSDLWLIAADGRGEPKRFTTGMGPESGPAWSPDSTHIAFAAKRGGDTVSQIHVMPLDGGEAIKVTSLTLGARNPQWSPDGKWILFQSSVHPGGTNELANKRVVEGIKKSKTKIRRYDSFPIRRWDRWLDDSRTHLFMVRSNGKEPEVNLLGTSELGWLPGFEGVSSEAGRDSLQPAWAPDSQSILFVASTNVNTAAYSQPTYQLYQVDLRGSEPRQLTQYHGEVTAPLFSGDGKWLALGLTEGTSYYSLSRIAVSTWPWTGKMEVITQSFDRSVAGYAFAPDNRTLYFTAEDSGRVRIGEVNVVGKTAPALLGGQERGVWSTPRTAIKSGKRWIYAAWGTADEPNEVYRLDPQNGKREVLSAFNRETLRSLDMRPIQEFWCTNKLGQALHNYVVLPEGFDPSQKYPLVVLIHGGHASMWRDSMTRRWNYHLLAQPGYVLLLTDYRGSTGYGEKFTRSILGDPLRGPGEDLNLAADEALGRFPFLDSNRQAAAGASYGGHLANWLEATTTRYRCLISHAGLTSLYTQWATSDMIYHREVIMGATFWKNPKAWIDQSPSSYAEQFKTPMLLTVGELDYRVPVNNVIEMWSLLQRQRVPSRLLVWPDENHWILKGENSKEFYREVHAWLEQWLGNGR